MSFRYNNQSVTLENYKDIFAGLSPDMLDEVRLAILDDTPIGNFISCCGSDYFKLAQFRKAVRELVPIEYLKPYFSGDIIKSIRLGIVKGYDMTELLKYANDKGVSLNLDSLGIIADFLSIGVDLSSVDFTKVPSSQVEIFCKGLFKNYPMWLLISDKPIEDNKISILMRGMDLGIDIHPFINSDWDIDIIVLLFSKVKSVDINALIGKITPRFTKDEIKLLLSLAQKSLSYDCLCLKDDEGNPVFNVHQMSPLVVAIEEGVLDNTMLNPNISDSEIWDLVTEALDKRDRVLKVSLNKKV